MTLLLFFFFCRIKGLSCFQDTLAVFELTLWKKKRGFCRRMSVQAKKSNLEICSAKGWPYPTYRRERHKISVTTFPSECKIAINNNNTEKLFDRDLHPNNGLWDARQCFYSESRNANIETPSSSFFFFFLFLFFLFCQIITVCMKNTCGPAMIFSPMHKVFFHYSNGTKKSHC